MIEQKSLYMLMTCTVVFHDRCTVNKKKTISLVNEICERFVTFFFFVAIIHVSW